VKSGSGKYEQTVVLVVVISCRAMTKAGFLATAVGCVAEDMDGCESWLVRNGYAEAVGGTWSKIGSTSTGTDSP
jgi:hypothetical protein